MAAALSSLNGKLLLGLLVTKAALLFGLLPFFLSIYPELYQANFFPDSYDLIAMNLIEGNGYRVYESTAETMIRLPGFVLVLAGVFSVFGKSILVVQGINLLCTVATCYLIQRVGERFLGLGRFSYLAAFFFAFHPAIIITETRGGLESIFTLLLTAFIYYVFVAYNDHRIRSWALAGLFLGLSVIFKSTTLLLGPVALVLLPLLHGSYRSFIRLPAVAVALLLPTIVLLSPWMYRNYELTGELVPTQTNLGTTAYQGLWINEGWSKNQDLTHSEQLWEATRSLSREASSLGLDYRFDFFQHFYSPSDEILFNKHVVEMVKRHYRNDPLSLIRGSLQNLGRFFFQGRSPGSTLINVVISLPVVAFAALGIVLLFRSGTSGLLLVFVLIGIFVAGHLPILATARYHVPILPLLLLAGTTVFARLVAWRALSKHRGLEIPPAAA